MKKDFNNKATDKQRLNAIGAMQGVERQSAVLAPTPDSSGNKGSVSAKKDKRANDTADSFFGTLPVDRLLTGGIGHVFSQAAALNVPSGAPQMSIADTASVAGELRMDRRDEQGSDGFRLGEHGAVKGTFNRCMTEPPFVSVRDKLDDLASYRPRPPAPQNNQPRPGF